MPIREGNLGYTFIVNTNDVLPDPAAAEMNGRIYSLSNTAGGAVTITSTGATPFDEGAGPVVSISLAAGQEKIFRSDGVRWILIQASPFGRRVYAASGTTNASGDVTFNFGTPFTATPKVTLAFQGAASQSPVDYRITALSTTSCTVNVRQSLATVIALLGLTLLAASAPLSGATIHIIAVEGGNV